MTDFPEMTDRSAWVGLWLSKYRRMPRWYCYLFAILFLPFCIIYWGALEGEAAMQASTEDRITPAPEKED